MIGAKILPSVDHITRIAAAAAAGKDGVATAGREEVTVGIAEGCVSFHSFPWGPLGASVFFSLSKVIPPARKTNMVMKRLG